MLHVKNDCVSNLILRAIFLVAVVKNRAIHGNWFLVAKITSDVLSSALVLKKDPYLTDKGKLTKTC